MDLLVKEIAKAKGISLKDIAEKIGISNGALSQNIAGRASIDRLKEIADILDVTVKDLFPEEESSIVCPNCGKRFKME